MTLINLPHIQRFKDRNGHLRHYYRRKGRKAVALLGAPGSAEFLAAYYAAAASVAPDAAAPKTGTIAAPPAPPVNHAPPCCQPSEKTDE